MDLCGRERCIPRRLKQGRTRRARGSDRCCYYHRRLPSALCLVALHGKSIQSPLRASALIGRDAAPARGPHRSAGRSRGGEVRGRCRPRPHAPDARPLPSNSDRTATRREQVIRAGPPAPPLVHERSPGRGLRRGPPMPALQPRRQRRAWPPRAWPAAPDLVGVRQGPERHGRGRGDARPFGSGAHGRDRPPTGASGAGAAGGAGIPVGMYLAT